MSNNSNSVLEYLKANNEVVFNKIVKALRKGKNIDFYAIKQTDIIVLSPQKAFEYAGEEGDKYFKVWMIGSTIAWCTWANSMVDSDFRWNAKARNDNKRDNKDILGNEPYISEYLKSNSAIEQCSVVYMFPFDAFCNGKKPNEKRNDEEKKVRVREQLDKSHAKKIEELIEELEELSESISGTFAPTLPGFGWLVKMDYNSERTEFDNCLMKLKFLDEKNKWIPYFEKMAKDWDYKKAGTIEKIVNVFKK